MQHNKRHLSLKLAPMAAGFTLATVLPFVVGTASALDLNLGNGMEGRLDTTVSYGAGWRVEAQDPSYQRNQARTWTNKNDGNDNFDNSSDPFTSTYKATMDLEIKSGDVGLFVRGSAFYDTVIKDDGPTWPGKNNRPNNDDCNPQLVPGATNATCGFSQKTEDFAGSRARLLDAYVYTNFDIAGHATNIRLGNQVINWGEALFLQDGINSANPISLSQLRLPGAEVKEALLPLPMALISLELTDALSAEAFYQFDWDFSEADAVGTYYSTDDSLAGYGAERVLVDTNALGASAAALASAYNQGKYGVTTPFLTMKRAQDDSPDNQGQWGLAFRYFAESLNNTEFGAYFMNYHSHRPAARGLAGEARGVQTNAALCATAREAVGLGSLTCNQFLTLAGQSAQLAQVVGTFNAFNYIDTSQYQLFYPEDIHMYGLSFSTTAGELSVAGEVAYRPKDYIINEHAENAVFLNSAAASVLGNGGTVAQLGEHFTNVAAGKPFNIYETVESVNASVVIINNFGPAVWTDGLVGVLEVGASHISNIDDNKHYASAASLANTCFQTSCIAEGPKSDYLDNFSWGYRAVLNATYNDVFAGVTLNPVLRFAHDVDGNSHRTGNFLENRKSASLAVNAIYNQALEVGLTYNAFWGNENSNLIADRDNVTASVKYSF